MGLITILAAVSGILFGFILIALGVLIVRYKATFSLIKKSAAEPIDDIDESADERQGLLPNAMSILSDSFSFLVGGKQAGNPSDGQYENTHKAVILIGQALIVIGYIMILTAVVSAIIMLKANSRYNHF
ncbi:MAG: putative membrane protein [Crocinitomix sp.]|jgi:uncharacterized membrane protein